MYTCEVACLSSIDLFSVDSGKCLGYILLNSDHFWLLEVYWRAGQNDLAGCIRPAGRSLETPELDKAFIINVGALDCFY